MPNARRLVPIPKMSRSDQGGERRRTGRNQAKGPSFDIRANGTEKGRMIGKRCWAIPEGYIPSASVDEADRSLVSHEAACILNAGDADARLEITVYYSERDPIGPYRLIVPARRTLHLRFNDLDDPEPIPRDTDYASIIRSDQPIVVQHTRLDSRRPEISLLTTIAYSE